MKNQCRILLFLSLLAIIFSISECAPLESFSEGEKGYEAEEEKEVRVARLWDDMSVEVMKNGSLASPAIWPKGKVRYKIDPGFGEKQENAIKLAMLAIEAVSCVRFLEAGKNAKAFVHIVPAVEKKCNSMVGYRGQRQFLRLAKNVKKCFKPVIIMHELFHTLGFYHEHMMPNRDDYISVNFENITPGLAKIFTKLDNGTVTDFGYGYDYRSIMHYGPKGYSANGFETISPFDSEVEIGQRIGLSLKDIRKLNAMYNCTLDYANVQN